MIISLFLMVLMTASGFALTYLVEREEPLMWRLAAGSVIGSAIFGTVSFVAACFLGFSIGVTLMALIVSLLPLAILSRKENFSLFRSDWQRAKGKLQGANGSKILTFAYYAFFAIVLWLFFERAMLELPDGIYTGASHNLGDLPFHLGAIFGFTDGANFPPQNPSFGGAKFSYPFIADVTTACFVRLGTGVRDAMLVQNFSWAFALMIVLDRFVRKLTGERSAGKIAVFLLFFCGGLGFLWFLSDFRGQALGFWDFLSHLPRDYTMNDDFSWGNSLVTLFITQRSLLLGMPITIVVLGFLWETFVDERDEPTNFPDRRALLVGLIAGCLPLIHLHSLAVLFVVTLFLLIIKPEKWPVWVTFGLGVCVIAIPELAWSISGSASKATSFIGFHFGWDNKKDNILWFWLRNTGLVIPAAIAGLSIAYLSRQTADSTKKTPEPLLLFYLPFLFCFLIANVTKLAPWEWDNIKVLIYWFVGSLPFIALAILWLWRKNTALKAVAIASFICLIAAGSLDVWRTISGQIRMNVFDRESIQAAELIKKDTPPNSLFLNAPTYNTAVVLTGRESLMRFPGHLWSHGIDYAERESDVKKIYAGTYEADRLLSKYGVDYVLISPTERSTLTVNEDFFMKYPVVGDTGNSRIYKIR